MCPCDGSSQLDGDGIDSSASQCYAGLEWQQSGHEARRQKEANNAVDEKKTGTGKEVGHEKQKECGDEKTFRESDGENGCCCCQEAGEVGFLLRAGCVS